MEGTRVFVSGLPPSLSNQDLGKHFGSRFPVTDAHVIPKRRIGFVGFKDAAIAKQAVDYFNKTYIRMSKISVEIARPVSVCITSLPMLSLMSSCELTDQDGPGTDQYYGRYIQRVMKSLLPLGNMENNLVHLTRMI